LLGTSQNGGTTSESLIYNTTTTAATYYAYVYGYGGAFSATSCYTLRAEISSTSFARLSGESEVDESMVSEGSLSVYPNPSNGSLNIRLQPEADLTQTITVYNQLGQEVDSYEVSFTKEQPAVEIRMNDLNDGIYFVRVFDGNAVQTRKVLLRK
jgi:alkyl hydroperoxide reductase subunit AhpF